MLNGVVPSVQATLCGVWSALQWPAADVRVVTMGSPAVGNVEFARVSFSPSMFRLSTLPCLKHEPGQIHCGSVTQLQIGQRARMMPCVRTWDLSRTSSISFLGCVQAFKLAVGREYRLVDRLDVVPALPPFTGYIQPDFPLWIQVWLPYPQWCYGLILPGLQEVFALASQWWVTSFLHPHGGLRLW